MAYSPCSTGLLDMAVWQSETAGLTESEVPDAEAPTSTTGESSSGRWNVACRLLANS